MADEANSGIKRGCYATTRVVRGFSRWTGMRTLAIGGGLALCSLLAHARGDQRVAHVGR